jgi:hypothetical protein
MKDLEALANLKKGVGEWGNICLQICKYIWYEPQKFEQN